VKDKAEKHEERNNNGLVTGGHFKEHDGGSTLLILT
jgi:hypothetical protein